MYDRLYGNKQAKTSSTQNVVLDEQKTQEESLNINIVAHNQPIKRVVENKENQMKQQIAENESADVDVKDINSKLSRLQDLLKMAKQT